jgi:hypothetical protein
VPREEFAQPALLVHLVDGESDGLAVRRRAEVPAYATELSTIDAGRPNDLGTLGGSSTHADNVYVFVKKVNATRGALKTR